MSIRRATGALAVLVLCAYIMTTGGSFATDMASYEVTRSIVENASVAMSYDVLSWELNRGVDGRYYAPVGLGHPLFGVPFYAAARAAQQVLGIRLGKPESLLKAAVVTGSAVAAALCVVVTFRFAAASSASVPAAATAAIALAFSTGLWPYSKFGFNAPLAALAVTAGTFGTWSGVRFNRTACLVLGGACLGYGALTRHELMLTALPAGVWIALESASVGRAVRRLVVFCLPFGSAVLCWMIYNYVRFGPPLDTGFMRDPGWGPHASLLVGLHGLLLSSGRSLFLYNPLVLVAVPAMIWLWRRDRNTVILLGGTVLAQLFTIARLESWDGGESYGPRYLLPIVPLLLVGSTPWLVLKRLRYLTAALMAIGVCVQLPGVLMDYSIVQNEFARATPGYSIQLTRYSWRASPLVLNATAAAAAIPDNTRYLLGLAKPPAVAGGASEAERGFSRQFAFSLNFWWLYLFYFGVVPAWASVAVAGVLATGAIWASKAFRGAVRCSAPPYRAELT